MPDDAFERWLDDLVARGAMVPPPDATPAEMALFRAWAADIWLSWQRFDLEHPHAAEIDIARAEIDGDWADWTRGAGRDR
jgi:hypothetical protein